MKSLDLIYARHNLNSIPPEVAPIEIAYNDLTIVLKGKLEYNIDGNDISVCGGDFIFMPVGSLRVRKPCADNVDYISFNFTADSEIALPEYFADAVHSDVLLIIAAYDKINDVSYLDNKEKNEHLLACLISVLEDRVKSYSFNPLTLKIMEFIHTNLRRKITLDDIGKLTFFSPIYCDTVFKRETGRSIIDYVLDKRIDEAKKLLIEGSLALRQISEVVGFNDYNYFSRVFKARSGYSPTVYRRITLNSIQKAKK